IGDYDNDGLVDIFIPDMNYFSLYRNDLARMKGKLLFEDVAYSSGLAGPVGQFVGWGGFFFDYDNDGWIDLFTATGEAHRPENQPNVVLRNLGNGKYVDVSEDLGERVFSERRLSRGAAAGDLDNDGDLDIVVVNLHSKRTKGKGGLPTILLNDGGNAASWIQIRLRGTRSNRDGIGAKVRVSAGRLRLFDEARSAPSYLSSTEARLHFGLGGAKKVDRLEIDWPSGAKQILENVTVNQLLTVKEPAKKKEPVKKGGK
ncbi:MAG: CRTAC1 family protein, partial [Planctomycetota bacterium]